MITIDFILGVIFGTFFGAACVCVIVWRERKERKVRDETIHRN